AERRRRRETEAREAEAVGHDEAREGGEGRGAIEGEVRHEMTAALGAGGSAGAEDRLGGTAREVHVAEGRGRDRWNVLPARDRAGAHAAPLAERAVRRVPLELVCEDAERPGLEVGKRLAAPGRVDGGDQLGVERVSHGPDRTRRRRNVIPA